MLLLSSTAEAVLGLDTRLFFLGLASPLASCMLEARLPGVFLGVPAIPAPLALAAFFFLGVDLGFGEAAPSLETMSLFLILAQALEAERGLLMPAKAASFS